MMFILRHESALFAVFLFWGIISTRRAY